VPGFACGCRLGPCRACPGLAAKRAPILTYLLTENIDGQGPFALHATTGYDDATGVGSPQDYIQSFAKLVPPASTTTAQADEPISPTSTCRRASASTAP